MHSGDRDPPTWSLRVDPLPHVVDDIADLYDVDPDSEDVEGAWRLLHRLTDGRMRRIAPPAAREADFAAHVVNQPAQLARALVIGRAESLHQVGTKSGEHSNENSGDERQHSPEAAIGFRT